MLAAPAAAFSACRNACVYRRYNDQNRSMLVGGGGYGTEMYLYETLLQSEHRYGFGTCLST